MYDEFFEELLKFNNVMVEKGFISNFSASIEDEKNLYIEKFERDCEYFDYENDNNIGF